MYTLKITKFTLKRLKTPKIWQMGQILSDFNVN
jgi:hypothetical protein